MEPIAADPGPALRDVPRDRRIAGRHVVGAGRPHASRTRGRSGGEVPAARGPSGDDAARGESRLRAVRSDPPGGRRGGPPPSGQRGCAMIDVRRARIDLDAVVDSVRRDDAGAIVLFVGTVRSDERVRALDYEVYRPMAIKSLTALAERARDKFGLTDMSIVHRVGRVPVGGDSVAIACAAVHRAEAFAACAWVMDEVKRIIPIWKTEIADRPDGVRRRRGPEAPGSR